MKNLIINKCRHTYIDPIFNSDKELVKLNFKGKRITDYITYKEAYITIMAMLKADEINYAEQYLD